MTVRCFRLLALLMLGGAASLLAGGCGGGVPGGGFAAIDGRALPTSALEHWISIAARGEGRGAAGRAPVPPAFTACIAGLRASAASQAGRKAESGDQLKASCEQRYRTLLSEMEGYLISSQWVIDEAAALRVPVTDSEVHRRFALVRQEGLSTAASLEKFLASSGYTVSDLLLRVKIKMLSERIEARIIKGASTVTADQVDTYYARNRSRYKGDTPAKARAAIKQQLAFAGEQAAIGRFSNSFRSRWTAKTDCRAGYVVADCRQYRPPAVGSSSGS